MPVKVTVGKAVTVAPLSVMPVPENPCAVFCAVNVVALFVKLFVKVNVAAAPVVVSFHTAPPLSVTAPLKVIMREPAVDPKFIVPVIDVVPFTINGRHMVSTEPLLIVSPAQVIVLPEVVTAPAPVVAMTTESVASGTTPPTHVVVAAQSPPAGVLVLIAASAPAAITKPANPHKTKPIIFFISTLLPRYACTAIFS